MRISVGKVFFVCVLVGSVTYGIRILRGFHPSAERQRQIELLEKENEILYREIVAKENHLRDLEQNPDQLALEIKGRLGLVNPGSKSYILQDGTKTKAAPQPQSGTEH
jgi:cell division protein FtsB